MNSRDTRHGGSDDSLWSYTTMGRNLGAVMESKTGVGMALQRLKDTAEFIEPFVVPGTPSVQSVPTLVGGLVKFYDQQRKERKK